ncbi:MAG TPA: hypothetical protein VGM56_12230 [Byssovorax sp.]|jgi:hypothetical protein
MRIPDAISIDSVADAALSAARDAVAPLVCDACDEPIEGEAAGSGLYVWRRGDELRLEEPPLCSRCAAAITVTALQAWDAEEDDGE